MNDKVQRAIRDYARVTLPWEQYSTEATKLCQLSLRDLQYLLGALIGINAPAIDPPRWSTAMSSDFDPPVPGEASGP